MSSEIDRMLGAEKFKTKADRERRKDIDFRARRESIELAKRARRQQKLRKSG